jgi:SAM-dependent MidA family methyltransferase
VNTIEPFAVRSEPERTLPDVPSNPALVTRIASEIAAGGPMTFARFMELALYDSDHGYYSSAEARPTRTGDFLTAPELDPIFGRALARQVAEVHERLGRPRPFTIREYGAGSGALATSVLDGLDRDAPALAADIRYEPVEHNRHRLAELRDRLATEGRREPATPDGRMTGVVIANEFLDALPVHRVVGADPTDPTGARVGLLELYVDSRAGELVEVAGPPSTDALAARLEDDGVRLAPGQRAEIRLDDAAWVADVGRDLDAGVAIVIDYALPAIELYAASRPDGTLLAYLAQLAHTDPFRSIGRQDLTAHVDATALRRAAADARLDLLGETSQAEFLVGNGLEALVEEERSAPATDLARWTALRAAVARLLDPRAMGAFRVFVLARGLAPDPPLRGLAFRLPGGHAATREAVQP